MADGAAVAGPPLPAALYDTADVSSVSFARRSAEAPTAVFATLQLTQRRLADFLGIPFTRLSQSIRNGGYYLRGNAEVKTDSAQTQHLLQEISRGDHQALEQLLERHRPKLHAFIEARLDPKLRARLDPSDVVQEAQMEVVRRMDDFLRRRPMPFHLWARKTAYQRLLNLRRDHRQRARRSVDREVGFPDRSSLLLARPFLSRGPSPSQRLAAREFADRVARAVAQLAETDREILLMRHAEELPYEEIACLLEIEPAAARKRYGRALIRLQKVLSEHGLLE
jgi:RNA polymerase sigma-70 factor (ECF subfamily)